jgi:hypothetical protein
MSGKYLAGLITGLALLLGPATARADLVIRIDDPLAAGGVILIADNSAFDTNAAVGEIAVDADALNAALGAGRAFNFVSLGAFSNRTDPVAENGLITLSGTIVATDVPGLQSVTIDTTDDGFVDPDVNPRILSNSVALTVTDTTADDSATSLGANDPDDLHWGGIPGDPNTDGNEFVTATQTFALPTVVPGVPFGPFGGTEFVFGINEDNPYSLSQRLVITTGPAGATVPTVGFSQQTGKIGVPAAVIPEPASVVGLGVGGLALAGYARRRRVKA